jgi:ketosteroid isomerase-like protein
MSRENVEVVRRAFESFNRRDLAAAVDAFDADAEWVPYLAALEEEIYRGRDEIETMWREVLTDVPDFRIELVDVVADEGDTVVVEVDFLGMGRASGADIRTTVYQAASLRRQGDERPGLPHCRRSPRSRWSQRVDGSEFGGARG